MFLHNPIHHLHHHSKPHQDLLAVHLGLAFLPFGKPHHALAIPRVAPGGVGHRSCLVGPDFQILRPPVVLGQEVAPEALRQAIVLHGVVPGVQAQQDGPLRQPLGERNDAGQEGRGALLAMLGALPELESEGPALLAQVGRNGGIALELLVGPADALLLRLGVVEGGHVHVQGDMAGGKRRDRRLGHAKEVGRGLLDIVHVEVRPLIKTLPDGDRGREGLKAEALGHQDLVLQRGHGFEVALSGAERRDVGHRHVARGDGAGPLGKLPGKILVQRRVPAEKLPDQGKAGPTHQIHALRLHEFDFHPGHPQGDAGHHPEIMPNPHGCCTSVNSPQADCTDSRIG